MNTSGPSATVAGSDGSQQAEKLMRAVNAGSNWFYRIAGLSVLPGWLRQPLRREAR